MWKLKLIGIITALYPMPSQQVQGNCKFSLYLINKYMVNVYVHGCYVITNCQHFRCCVSNRFMLEWKKEGQALSYPRTSTMIILFCSRLALLFSIPAPWTPCTILLTVMSSKSPGLIKYYPHACILLWPKPHNDKECVRLFQMPACIYHTWDCLPAPV
jgi:hypothetical protein